MVKMVEKYMTRETCEKLARTVYDSLGLLSQSFYKSMLSIKFLSDFQLLNFLNEMLILGNCTPLTKDELEAELT